MRWFTLIILLVWVFLLAIYTSGCGGWKSFLPEDQSTKKPCTPIQQSLNPGLDKIILLGVMGLGVGLGLFFMVPGAHKLSLTIAGVAGGLEVSALFLRVSLPAIVWVVYSLIAIGAVALVYEVYKKIRNRGSA